MTSDTCWAKRKGLKEQDPDSKYTWLNMNQLTSAEIPADTYVDILRKLVLFCAVIKGSINDDLMKSCFGDPYLLIRLSVYAFQ